jgi:hypothetical protein
MPSFYFEQLLQRGLSGIDQQGITAAVLQIAGVILIFSLVWSVYEAYTNGGDVRALGVAALKYLVLGIVFLNYSSAFRAVNSMFNGVADGIYNLSGGLDVLQAWGNSMSQAWSADPNWYSTLWGLVTGGLSVAIAAIITIVGYLLLPFTYTLFTLFYALYGAILYVVGPFVLALMPSRAMGQLSKSFFSNLMIFQCWGLLYAILQSLMSALQITDPMQFTGSFLNAFSGSSQVVVMSIASLLLSIMIALIPFIASRIVRGDIGSTLMTVVSAGAVASGLAFAGAEGQGAGRALAAEGPPPPPAGPVASSSTPALSSVSQSPGLAQAGSAIGQSSPPTPLSTETSATQSAGSSPSGTQATSDSGTTPSVGGASTASSATGTAVESGAGTGATTRTAAGTTRSTGGSGGHSSRGYGGRSLAGLAAWRAGHAIGTTMRLVGMGRES